MDQTRGDDGQFIENTTTDDVLELLETANEPLTAVEVADRLNISNRTALDNLDVGQADATVMITEEGQIV